MVLHRRFMGLFTRLNRQARRDARRNGADRAIMPLTESREALGASCWTTDVTTVPVDQIVGTAARTDEFDRLMRPLLPHLRGRWERVASAMRAGVPLPAIRLVQLGELYFVVDGHHRVSVARATDVPVVDASVRKVCTIAYACECLTILDLPNKDAERRFLERYPLPNDARPWLWLDDPADWTRVENAARAWVFGDSTTESDLSDIERRQRVEDWWRNEVTPTAHRRQGTSQTNLTDYLCAIRSRDDKGCCIAPP